MPYFGDFPAAQSGSAILGALLGIVEQLDAHGFASS